MNEAHLSKKKCKYFAEIDIARLIVSQISASNEWYHDIAVQQPLAETA